jgi:hypothetical protein
MCGVQGYAAASVGEVYGVRGNAESTDGYGVYGKHDYNENYGYLGGHEYAVFGSSDEGGSGALGDASTGVYGVSSASTGRGVYGQATATSGNTYGVWGYNASTDGRGVYGYAVASTGTTYGVYGESSSTSGMGVYGWAAATTGNTNGVFGESSSPQGQGVYGRATASSGFAYGVYGQSSSTTGTGVCGLASASTGGTTGVLGTAVSTSGFGVWYNGGLGGTGSKSCVVRTSQGPTLLYCQESPENWFEDFGEGQLMNGCAHIKLDPLFLETVTIDDANPMKVFVQLRDDCNGTYVKTEVGGFDVIELQGGTSRAAFAYRVVAKRKGFEDKRLDFCEVGLTDSYLYPELREKELQELEEGLPIGEERVRMDE